ncbi:MAG: 50S ribosomal protein L27 [Candidatus Saccharibacteria bacterium]
MSHVKAGGTAKNIHDSPGQRLGVKLYGGQKTRTGNVIVRQVGMTKRAGKGTLLSRNFTIHAMREGVVTYTTRRVRLFNGKSVKRVEVTVTDAPAPVAKVAKKAPAKK